MIFKDILKYVIILVAVLLMGMILNKGEDNIEKYTTFLRESNLTASEWKDIKKDDSKKCCHLKCNNERKRSVFNYV